MVAAKTDMVTLKGRTDVSHIPYQPFWLLIIRGFQLLLSIIILGLSAYAGAGYYVYAGYGIGIFSFVWTLLFLCYIEISTFFWPVAYNKYAHLVLEILCVIFWLSTFGALAAVAAAWSFTTSYSSSYSSGTTCVYGICVRATSYDSSSYANSTKAAAALGAIEWALFVGTLITFGIYLHRHRRAEQENHTTHSAPAAVEEHKMQPMVNQQPVQPYPTQAPTYPTYQQPVDPRYQQQTMA